MPKIDSTARADMIAQLVRYWYQQNKPSWWQDQIIMDWQFNADEFILGLIQAVHDAENRIDNY